ncbi:ABC transporter permease [Acidothermaceae bacterium B102]|nr:ABC transporter permease [Acidothermaceae bacterium B102]
MTHQPHEAKNVLVPAPAGTSTAPLPSGKPESDPISIRALIFIRDRGLFVLWALVLLTFTVWAHPYFGSVDNAKLIANAAAITAIYAAGVAVGIICGALDLSIPGSAALASCVCGWLMIHGTPTWLALLAGLGVGVVVGVVNGVISLRGFNPIVVTIGTLSITTAAASIIVTGSTIPGLDKLHFMGTQRYGGVPAPVYIAAAVFLILTIFLTRTRDGIRMMSVGGNAEAVRRSGIPAGRYKVLGFVISAGCAALGGLVNTAVVTEANPDASPAIIFTALTAVALAGVSLAGGRGSLPRVLVGALLLATISNGLTVKGIDPYWGTGVTGLLLLASLGLEKWISDSVSNRLVATAQASVHSGRR